MTKALICILISVYVGIASCTTSVTENNEPALSALSDNFSYSNIGGSNEKCILATKVGNAYNDVKELSIKDAVAISDILNKDS